MLRLFFVLFVLAVLLQGCSPAAAPASPSPTPKKTDFSQYDDATALFMIAREVDPKNAKVETPPGATGPELLWIREFRGGDKREKMLAGMHRKLAPYLPELEKRKVTRLRYGISAAVEGGKEHILVEQGQVEIARAQGLVGQGKAPEEALESAYEVTRDDWNKVQIVERPAPNI
ncbi:MAG: hypothetical protein HY319_18340 [Armatimonadetes bacterium]|nr:hypothetical protein [Armatimonadota bacterium]